MKIQRSIKDSFFSAIVTACGIFVLVLLIISLLLIFKKGISTVNWEFISMAMSEGGLSGGVYYQIAGTLILFVTTLFVVCPLAFGLALFRGVYLKNILAKKILTTFLYVLNSVPSIIFGLFGFFFFVKYLGWGKSWLTGGILLGFMILPTVALTLSDGIKRVPEEYLESAMALGLNPSQIIFTVLIPQSFSSFISGLLIGLARAAGETAPIMFAATIFSGATIPDGIVDNPVLTLPYHIFTLTQESYQQQALDNAWGSACLLVFIVFALSFIAMPFRIKAHEEAKHE